MPLNTDNIEDAQVIEDNKDTQTEDLLARLSKQTAIKEPGTVETKKADKGFWESSDDDFEKTEEKPIESENKADEKTNKSVDKPLSDSSFHNSASNATFLTDLVTEGICKIIVSKKYKKKFTPKEKEALNNGLAETNPNLLNDEQKHLYEKYQTLTKKRDATFEKLPFDDDEKRVMDDAWFRYFKQKNKELPPEAAVIMSIVSSVGSRIVDIAFD